MILFEKLKARYKRGGCRKDQLVQFVELDALTEEEYEEITGEDFPTDDEQ